MIAVSSCEGGLRSRRGEGVIDLRDHPILLVFADEIPDLALTRDLQGSKAALLVLGAEPRRG